MDYPDKKDKGQSQRELAAAIMSRNSRLESDRSYWMSMWQSIANLVMPRKSYILTQTITPSTDREQRLFDSTGVRANMILANGCMSYITPSDARWCNFTAPDNVSEEPGVQEYFSKVTETVMETLARSNFHTAIHELYLDRGCFGTAVIFVEPGETTPIIFRNIDVGTFSLSENHESVVDTLFRKFEMTARQLEQEFGKDALPEHVRKCCEAEGKNIDQKFEVLHAIYPRSIKERDVTKKDGENKPYASCYIETKSKTILREGGYDEKPFMATRFLKWQSGVYGWSPSWVALPDIRQLNFLQKQMDALAELAAFPRVLVPDGMESTVDLRAGGITYFNASDPSAKPQEWATQGRYDVGLQRIQEKQRHVEEAFHVPLFQMFSNEESMTPNRMTATEVNARNAERLTQFSPTFSRLTTELLIPLLQRVYGILARNGMFPPPPEALIQQAPDGSLFIPEPKVEFNSRIALAVERMAVTSTDESVQMTGGYVQITQDPSLMDNFDMDKIVRKNSLSRGMDAELLRDPEEIAMIRQQRAEAQAQMAQMQQNAMEAEMMQKAGSVKGDSMLAQGMRGQQVPMA